MFGEAKLRISEGNTKFICVLPSGSMFGEAKYVYLFRMRCIPPDFLYLCLMLILVNLIIL